MSLLDTLKGWEHTFTAWAAKQYQAFRNEEPSLVALSDRVFPYAKSALQIALSFEAPEVAAAAGPIVDKIHSEFDTAAALLYDFGATPTLGSALQTAQNDLATFETAAGIKSDSAKNAIAKALGSVQAFVSSASAAIAAVKTPAA